jgi:phosphonate transport system permease protein
VPGGGFLFLGQRARGTAYFLLFVSMVVLFYWATTTTDVSLSDPFKYSLLALIVLFWVWQIAAATAASRNTRWAFTGGIVGILGFLLFLYLLGWQATEIDFARLFKPSPETIKIFTEVIWPWNAAFQREQHIVTATTPFANPCPQDKSTAPAQVKGDGDKPWVVVDPACGDFSQYNAATASFVPGTSLTFSGGGFQPDRKVQIWWRTSLGDEFQPFFSGETLSATPDQKGEFTITFPAPQQSNVTQVGVQIHQVEARQLVSEGQFLMTDNFKLAVSRMLVTVFQALMATTLGLILAIPFGFLAARNLMFHSPITRVIYSLIRLIMNVARSIEPFIWAVIATVWVGLGPFAGVIALAIHTVASLGKQYSEAIEDIDNGPIEAITATGANRFQTIVYAIVPQMVPPFLSFTIYRWDINVRLATIIGLVGGGGIGQLLFQWLNQFQWQNAGIAAWLITITVTGMDYLSTELRKRAA